MNLVLSLFILKNIYKQNWLEWYRNYFFNFIYTQEGRLTCTKIKFSKVLYLRLFRPMGKPKYWSIIFVSMCPIYCHLKTFQSENTSNTCCSNNSTAEMSWVSYIEMHTSLSAVFGENVSWRSLQSACAKPQRETKIGNHPTRQLFVLNLQLSAGTMEDLSTSVPT